MDYAGHLVIVILIRYCCRYERRDYEYSGYDRFERFDPGPGRSIGKCDPGLGGISLFFHEERRVLCFLSISKSLF